MGESGGRGRKLPPHPSHRNSTLNLIDPETESRKLGSDPITGHT